MAKINKVTQFDDWSVWEALKMAPLKGHEHTVYNVFAAMTANRQQISMGLSSRQTPRHVTIIDMVGTQHHGRGLTDLSQTQVRYAMKKLMEKGMVQCTQGSTPVQYKSLAEVKQCQVAHLQRQEYLAREEYGDLDNMKEKVTKKVLAIEKHLRKVKRLIAAGEFHQEVTKFDTAARWLVDLDL